MSTLHHVRQTFLNYFASQGHTVVPSSPLILPDDPTLLFANAGMNQFKNYFTGVQAAPYLMAASSQKCVRAGGKHNDLDNVGYTARHHTFFEMLGNFSFGGYFKEQAIVHAWTLLTREFGIDPRKLCVTVFHTDDEAAQLWQKVAGLSNDKIIRISSQDNFWSMGDTGPCGPCSEIFYDHGDHIFGGPPGSVDQDGDRFTEIWNLVFMQYNQQEDGVQHPLPLPCIDTGAGLERLTSVLQGVHNNYDIDLFQKLISNSQHLTTDDPKFMSSHRVIADHLRSSSFILTDGVMPANEGRGYVLRRIMRRAMRHAYLLGAEQPLMHRLVPELITLMGQQYPELIQAQHVIVENLRLEEERFRQTLGRGLKLLDDEIAQLGYSTTFPGEVAFKLHDTYGFPVDLTQDVLREKNMSVAMDGFNTAMQAQKTLARASWQGASVQGADTLWHEVTTKCADTKFIGYDNGESHALVQVLIKDNQVVNQLSEGETGWLVVNRTPFYSEAGGQVGDHGQGQSEDQTCQFLITDTQKKVGKIVAHHITVQQGKLQLNQPVILTVDNNRRLKIRANHSATHLLHAMLRKVLGHHVTQKGSLVNADKLRFDFSHAQSVTPQQLQLIAFDVNRLIRANYEVKTEVLSLEAARQKGALALFGEKYGETVRVVSMCQGHEGDPTTIDQSIEFCGGTHVGRTGDIGLFLITSESGLAAGIRRIEAITGEAAQNYIHELLQQQAELAQKLKCPTPQLPQKIDGLIGDHKLALNNVKLLKAKLAGGANNQYSIKEIKEVKFISHIFNDLPVKELRTQMDNIKTKYENAIIVFGSNYDQKASIIVSVSPNLIPQYDAITIVKLAVPLIGGQGGGGRPEMAQAGGSDVDYLPQAITAIEQFINN